MTKKEQHSRQKIQEAITLINSLVVLERKRSSQQRKKNMENAYASLTLHSEKLGFSFPRLSTYYNPEQYAEHAQHAQDHFGVFINP